MRFGIAHKLALLLAVVGVVVSGATGYYGYVASRAAMVSAAKSELLSATQLIARRVGQAREEVSRNLLIMASQPAALRALRGDDGATDQVAGFHRLLMDAQPSYLQLRLIGAADGGLERVRLDRRDGRLQRVEDDALKAQGQHSYVHETLRLRPGQTWLSPISTQHMGDLPDQPTMVLAMPVFDGDGHGAALGAVVANIDLNGLFSQLSTDLPGNFRLFFANLRGDYLIHPDPARAFGFERGQRFLMQDEFPETRRLFESAVEEVVVEAHDGEHAAAPLLAAFVHRQVIQTSEDAGFVIGLSMPQAVAVAEADRLAQATLRIVLLLCLGCVLIAVVVARAVTRPLKMLERAVAGMDDEHSTVRLPVGRRDEIGELARRFEQQRREIRSQFELLERSRKELEHLARHDSLTGLPNRAMFADRVEQAISAARRGGDRVALMFIDLDHFKEVNDRLGHEAGDMLLREVASRIQGHVRESDTVARLGGDEFVVLLRNVQRSDDAASVATKICDALRQPYDLDGQPARVTSSIGIALHPDHGEDVDTLSRHADRAMYSAKQSGRDNVKLAT